MPLYTFIMDYKGGTYISQVNAKSLKEAVRDWGKQLNPTEIYGFGEKTKSILIEQLEVQEIVSIKDLQSVWCSSFYILNNFALVNIVKTESEQLTINN